MRFTYCFVVTALQSYKKEMKYAIFVMQIHYSTPYTTFRLLRLIRGYGDVWHILHYGVANSS